MYQENYIPDGPRNKWCYDHVMGASYYIDSKGRRNYAVPQEEVPHGIVPPDEESRIQELKRIIFILVAVILALIFSFFYIILKITSNA